MYGLDLVNKRVGLYSLRLQLWCAIARLQRYRNVNTKKLSYGLLTQTSGGGVAERLPHWDTSKVGRLHVHVSCTSCTTFFALPYLTCWISSKHS